jgi:hypothetical protein
MLSQPRRSKTKCLAVMLRSGARPSTPTMRPYPQVPREISGAIHLTSSKMGAYEVIRVFLCSGPDRRSSRALPRTLHLRPGDHFATCALRFRPGWQGVTRTCTEAWDPVTNVPLCVESYSFPSSSGIRRMPSAPTRRTGLSLSFPCSAWECLSPRALPGHLPRRRQNYCARQISWDLPGPNRDHYSTMPASLAAVFFFMSSFPSRPYMTFWVWGDPAPCIDSTRAVPPVMFSMRRRILMRFSVETP